MNLTYQQITSNLQPYPNTFTATFQEGSYPLIQINDRRNIIQRVRDVFIATLKQVVELFRRVQYYFYFFKQRNILFISPVKQENRWIYERQDLPWTNQTDSAGLYLFVHGLRGSPRSWGGYLKQLQKDSPKAHFLAPCVPLRGNCSLETAAEPFLHILRDYMLKFPGKPVTLVGTSNGSRIISDIETRLNVAEVGQRQLNVVSIAGVHYGTKLVDWLARWHFLTKIFIHPVLAEEFRWGSHFAKTLLDGWKEKQAEWVRNRVNVRHLFCATLEDEKVINVASTLPIFPKAHYQIYTRENHQTVVYAAERDVINWIHSPAA